MHWNPCCYSLATFGWSYTGYAYGCCRHTCNSRVQAIFDKWLGNSFLFRQPFTAKIHPCACAFTYAHIYTCTLSYTHTYVTGFFDFNLEQKKNHTALLSFREKSYEYFWSLLALCHLKKWQCTQHIWVYDKATHMEKVIVTPPAHRHFYHYLMLRL